MKFWGELLDILDAQMQTPTLYGWFHILFFALSVGAGVWLCVKYADPEEKFVRKLLLIVFGLSVVLEIYKQINYTFTYDGLTIAADYQWYAFPFQFCSTPMYVGVLAACLRKGKLQNALCTYLATYALFAGLCVMIYPGQVFIGTIGINIQTMICHGSMVTVGMYLLYSRYIKLEHKAIFKAVPVFACLIVMAMILNEIAHATGLLKTETFNMFFISPYCEGTLPVYSLVQGVVPYPWCTIIYIVMFTVAAYIMLLLGMLVTKKTGKKEELYQTAI